MKDFFSLLVAVVRVPWVWKSGVLLILALLVWFAGPWLSIDDHLVWASSSSRLLSIGLLCLVAGLMLVFKHWKAHVRKLADESEDARQERLRCERTINRQRAQMTARFNNVQRFLRGSRLFQRREERWRTELPWYLLLGPQESGKTSLLEFSDLQFQPGAKNPRKGSEKPGDTGPCDWYVADHAVLIDAVGSLLVQPDEPVDAAMWKTLLGLLRTRRTRPLNGVLLNIPVHYLYRKPVDELEALAGLVRRRLEEIHQYLGVNVPVYLVLSKADQLPGFDEFFSQLSCEESEQVFGVSFDKEQNSHDAHDLKKEFERLLCHLDKQVILRLAAEQDPKRRERILDFPQQLRAIDKGLCQLIESAFAGSRHLRGSQLRGFYLTSAPYWVTPTDTVTNSQKTPLAMDLGPSITPPPLPRIRCGQPRFIKHLLSRVIFPESTLAQLDPQAVRGLYWRQGAIGAGALGCLIVCGLLWTNTFASNHERMAQLLGLSQTLKGQQDTLSVQDDAAQALEVLDSAYAATQVFPQGAASYLPSGALDQDEVVVPVMQQTYEQLLVRELLPRVGRHLEAQVRANLHDREDLLNSLRAYLMLGLEEHRDTTFLKERMATNWSQRYTGRTEVQNRLNAHFERLLSATFPPYRHNVQLVDQARQMLRNEALSQVVYRNLVTQARGLAAYHLGSNLGRHAVFFAGSNYSIPGLYTQQGYQQFLLGQGTQVVQDLLRDNWVLGEATAVNPMVLKHLLDEVSQLYFHDYANHWASAIGHLNLAPIRTTAQGAEQLGALTAVNSPLLQLLRDVRDNTRRPIPPAPAGPVPPGPVDLAANAANKLGGADEKLEVPDTSKMPIAPLNLLPDSGWQALERRFVSWHELLDEEGNAGPDLIRALQALEALQQQLGDLAQVNAPGAAAFELAKARMAGEHDSIHKVSRVAKRLPAPFNTWLTLAADESWTLVLTDAHHYLNQRYQDELYAPYSESLQERYPFSARSQSNVELADFREFFKSGGIAERFIEHYLNPFISNTNGVYEVRKIEGRGLPMSPAILTQLEHVSTIQRSFFAENPNEPQVLFKLEPYSLDSRLSRADFELDDQHLEYRHGPIAQAKFSWPAKAGRSSLVLEELRGRRLSIEQNTGPWSLFRLIEMMDIEHHRSRDVLMLKADLAGQRVSYLLHSQRSPNPFDFSVLRRFQLPEKL
ncbi:type VI secretion system membrane subunit TssM [Pseudomonas sp. NPDC098747]|uniref:type VI secretion system membrane subunit TssM n=1 Tax=Pseudomonas sp. NPDC098747 TaxID=3364487 RepID=UPI00383A7C62